VLRRVLEVHASDEMQLTRANFKGYRDLKLAFHFLAFSCTAVVMSAETHVRSSFRCTPLPGDGPELGHFHYVALCFTL